MALSSMLPWQASQKATKAKVGKVGVQPSKMIAKNTAKTKKVAKTPTNVKGTKIKGPKMSKSLPMRGKRISKSMKPRVVKAR